jgi:tetratricopeptide (TPR) repeat protein
MEASFLEPGAILVPAREPSPTLSIDELRGLLPEGSRLFVLRCHFDEGGPWGGTRDLFRELLPALDSEGSGLLVKHDYELVHVLPHLRPKLGLRNPSLTDLASQEERVRNYPADRALRIVHGLIDLLITLKERDASTARQAWVLLCVDYPQAGQMSQLFLRELMRRAGVRSRLVLIPIDSEPCGPGDFATVPRALPFRIEVPARPPAPSPEEAERLARELEAPVRDEPFLSTGVLPELIDLWKAARRPHRIFEWRYKGLHAFNTLGLYKDALRYGEPAKAYCEEEGERFAAFRWGIFFKLLMCYLGVNDLEAAQKLAETGAPPETGDADDAAMRTRLCYMLAMIHARFLPQRDLLKGERYLERGLEYLTRAGLPESEHYFHFAFNRNGLAMIRSFQQRHQEALDLCREAWDLLDQHLDSGKHRLHRSVLLYNMAQVYTHTERFDLAIEHYTAAMGMDPNYSEYYNERGNLLLKLGRLEEAEKDYRQAIEIGAPYFEVWSNLGQCCQLRGRLEEAVAAYDRSLDLQPNQPMAWLIRAQVLESLGRIEAAISSYEEASSLQPEIWQAHAGHAVLLFELGKVEECLADLDRAIEIAPGEPELYQNRAVAHAELGRYEDASRDLRRYLELAPNAADRGEMEERLRSWSPAEAPPAARQLVVSEPSPNLTQETNP